MAQDTSPVPDSTIPASIPELYTLVNAAGLGESIEICSRTLGTLNRLIDAAGADCCLDAETIEAMEGARTRIRDGLTSLFDLSSDLPADHEQSIVLVVTVDRSLDGLVRAIGPTADVALISPADRVMRPGMLLLPGGPPILADVVGFPELPIPPDQAAQILDAIYEALRQAVAAAASANGALARARELLDWLRRYRAAVAAGGSVTVSELSAFLRPFLSEILTILRGMLSPQAWHALGRALVAAAEQLAAYLGGGSSAGAASITLLWSIVACLAAAGFGWMVGRLIGQITIGDKTVDGHMQDFFYWLLYSSHKICDEAWPAYLQAREKLRRYEASAQTLDKSVAIPLITEAVYHLSRYLSSNCEPDERRRRELEEELARLSQKLSRLTR